MKKLILWAAAITTASTANAAEIYRNSDVNIDVGGSVEACTTFKNNEAKGTSGRAVTDDSEARLNINAKNRISDKYYIRGFFETKFTPKNNKEGNSILDTRHVYIAFGNKSSELRYGKTEGSLGLVTDFTNIFYSYGGEAQEKLKTAARADNQLLYVGDFGRLTVKANVNGGGQDYKYERGNQKVNGQIRYGLGLSAKYDIGSGFSIGAGAAFEGINKGVIGNNSGLKGNVSEYVGGLSYTYDALYLGAGINYTEVLAKDVSTIGDVKSSSSGWELVGSYQLTEKWKAIIGYSDTSYNRVSSIDITNDTFASAELSYSFTSAVVTYAGIEYGLSGKKYNGSLAGRVGVIVTF